MKTKILVYACVALLSFTSCEDWLSQNDPKELSEDQAYSSVASISSIAANLYERIKLDQNFASDNESYDICRWDEATSNSYYWQFSSNVGRTYRNYYDYNLIRDINIHIRNLSEKTSHLPENQRAYFLGEARFLRAFTYFNMVKNLGGVPLITEVYDYSTTPIEYAKPRDTEAAVYEFVATEMDEVKEALDIAPQGSSLLTRATKASALALKSRAMLYAGTLAYNEDKSKTMGLTLTSGAVGISKNKATEYLQSCIDAYLELKEIGRYSLLKGTGSSLGENFNNVFVSKTNNPELILIRDYDGSTDFPNNFTVWNIPRSQRSTANFGGHVNPTLNLVESFETINSGSSQLNAYVGNEIIESMGNETSAYNYVLYDSPMGIFEGRDPRLWGTVILPGADFRGKEIQLQAATILSTPATVLILWAIMRTVLFSMSFDIDSWMSDSLSTSSEAVASSRRIIGASLRKALAMDILCLSPPDNSEPFSPIMLFHLSGIRSTNSSQFASLAAAITSSSVASFLPILIFSITVLLKRVTS
mgnify:CR=1 FL=1